MKGCGGAFGRPEKGAGVVLSKMRDPEPLRRLGVAQLNGDKRIERIIEKPESPPSDYAVTGIYFYDASVWEVLPKLTPSRRGELEITDVNNWYLEHGLMEYDVLDGFWRDAGASMQAYYKVQDFVREHEVNRTEPVKRSK